MKWLGKKVAVLLSAHYAHMLEYRAEIILWALADCLPLILMGAWIQASQQADFGLQSLDFARYFLSVFLVRQLIGIWVIWDFEKEVLLGKLSFRLLHPLDPVWHYIARHAGEKLTRLPFMAIFVALFFSMYPQAIWFPSLGNLLLGCLIIFMAFALRFIIQYTFAMCAFWTERASAIESLSFVFYLFLSGLIAPLEVFPPLVREIALWTPFPYFLNFPASVLVGLPVNITRSLLTMLVWFVLFLILNRWLWRRGLKRYSGMGA